MFFRFKGSKFLQLHPNPAESPQVFEIGQSDLIPLFLQNLRKKICKNVETRNRKIGFEKSVNSISNLE